MTESKSFTSSVHVVRIGNVEVCTGMKRLSNPSTHFTLQDQALSGFGAGLVSTAILHPLDVIKIRFQGKTQRSSFFLCLNGNHSNVSEIFCQPSFVK